MECYRGWPVTTVVLPYFVIWDVSFKQRMYVSRIGLKNSSVHPSFGPRYIEKSVPLIMVILVLYVRFFKEG